VGDGRKDHDDTEVDGEDAGQLAEILRRAAGDGSMPRVNVELAHLLLTGDCSEAGAQDDDVARASRRRRGRTYSQRTAVLAGSLAFQIAIGVGVAAAATAVGLDLTGQIKTPVGAVVRRGAGAFGIELPGGSANRNTDRDGGGHAPAKRPEAPGKNGPGTDASGTPAKPGAAETQADTHGAPGEHTTKSLPPAPETKTTNPNANTAPGVANGDGNGNANTNESPPGPAIGKGRGDTSPGTTAGNGSPNASPSPPSTTPGTTNGNGTTNANAIGNANAIAIANTNAIGLGDGNGSPNEIALSNSVDGNANDHCNLNASGSGLQTGEAASA
jgi:hypothetical protein